MVGLFLILLLAAFAGFKVLFWAFACAQHQWWLPFAVLVFFAMVLLGIAWRAGNHFMLAMLGLSSPRLALRDFKNDIADWLVSSRTGWKD